MQREGIIRVPAEYGPEEVPGFGDLAKISKHGGRAGARDVLLGVGHVPQIAPMTSRAGRVAVGSSLQLGVGA